MKPESRPPALVQAESSVAAAIPQAQADSSRPVYHFRPPAQWMNDPNGPLFYRGYYHLFYQHNPFADVWGPMYWGHARSRDLVHWEQLPIALWPSAELGESHCYSGCAWLNGAGQPMLFYTKVYRENNQNWPYEQWAATPLDDYLLTWQKHPANPILHPDTHGGPRFGDNWRDPFIFTTHNRVLMVIGADLETEAVVALYEAADANLVQWSYRGIIFRRPKTEMDFPECPNFFQVDGKWLLLLSPYEAVQYWLGDFDPDTLTFSPETHGILDFSQIGAGVANGFYASNVFFDESGRCILLGWVRGFQSGHGWNGCLALPRRLTISPDGHLRQTPVPELAILRGDGLHLSELTITGRHLLAHIQGDALELMITFAPDDATAYGLHVCCAADGSGGIAIQFDGQTMTVAGYQFPFGLKPDEAALTLHLFLDKSVLELFINGGCASATRVITPTPGNRNIALVAQGGSCQVTALDVWPLTTIW